MNQANAFVSNFMQDPEFWCRFDPSDNTLVTECIYCGSLARYETDDVTDSDCLEELRGLPLSQDEEVEV
jgi:hypothetical protein